MSINAIEEAKTHSANVDLKRDRKKTDVLLRIIKLIPIYNKHPRQNPFKIKISKYKLMIKYNKKQN